MKLNLIIRTFDIENLNYSLFTIPNRCELDPKDVNIIIHNDNPWKAFDLGMILADFHKEYPDYKVSVVNENENVHMFMSFINTCAVLDKDFEWTMMLDDDDNVVLTKELADFVDSECVNHSKVWTDCEFYRVELDEPMTKDKLVKVGPKTLPQLLRTDVLLKLASYKDKIAELLIKYNGSIKFSTGEDHLNLALFNVIDSIFFNYYDTRYANSHRGSKLVTQLIRERPHECNGYTSWMVGGANSDEAMRNYLILDKIKLDFIKYLFNESK